MCLSLNLLYIVPSFETVKEMKRVNRIAVAFAALTVGLFSCKKAIDCETPVIKKVFFYSSISSLLVPDTSAKLEKYRKGTNFGALSERFPNIRLQREDYNKSLEIPDNGAETYDYDWKITLMPSGRDYYISDIKHESETSKTHHCTNTVKYTITYNTTDTTVTVPGNPYSATPYYVSDIQVQYW